MIRSTIAGSLLALALPACGNDASFTAIKTPEPPASDTSEPPEEEEPEVDPDALPECGDPGLVPATVSVTREDCLNEPVQRRFRPEIEWSLGADTPFSLFPDHYLSTVHPSVGHVTDDNGDGVVGAGDVPDIAGQFWDGGDWCLGTAWSSLVLRLISGDGSGEHWAVDGIPGEPEWGIGWTGNAMGDIDGDGRAEVVVLLIPDKGRLEESSEEHRVAAFNHDGTVAWVSDTRTDGTRVGCGRRTCGQIGVPTLADINQDGVVEVIFGPGIYDGRDGTPWDMPEDWDDTVIPVVADLEADGQHEVITRGAIYEQDMTLRCRFGWSGEYPAVADLDGDGIGEVVLSGSRAVTIVDSQCRFQRSTYMGDAGLGGPATIADYDGDGQPEIGVASASQYFVYETDLTERWRKPVQDYSSNQTGSSVYDFDGDGYAEVVYAGEYNLWIYSGVDGTVRMQETSHYSCTHIEYPLTVDVDGDGQVEIVVVDANGIRVVGDRDNGWVPGRQVWNQHAYSIHNVNDDLSIPTYNRPNWPEYNSYRSADQRFNNGDGANLVDAVPVQVDVCEVECDRDTVQVTLRAANQGLADAGEGVDWSLYSVAVDGSRTLLESISGETVLRSGYTTEGLTFRFDMGDLPTGSLVVVADDDGTGVGTIEECDETNNELVLEGLCSDE